MKTETPKAPETPKKATPKVGSTVFYFDGVMPLDIKKRDLDKALEKISLEAKEPQTIILDLGAATGDIIKPWLKDFRETLVEFGVLTTLLNPIKMKRSTVVNLQDWVTAIRPLVDSCGVVLNEVEGDDFHFFKSIEGTFNHFKIKLEKRSDDIESRLEAKHLSYLTALRLWDSYKKAVREGSVDKEAKERLGDLCNIPIMARVKAIHGHIQEEFDRNSDHFMPVLATDGKPFQHRMVIVAAGSGGVGKSTISRALIDYYHSLGLTPIIFDGETESKGESK